MRGRTDGREIGRLLVVLPNWVGDVVLATPVLGALRAHFGRATIAFLLRRYVGEIVDGGGWHDETLFWPEGEKRGAKAGTHGNTEPRSYGGTEGRRDGGTKAGACVCCATACDLVRDIQHRGFDGAILLTNSFRSTLVTWLGRVPRRIGYARDGRSWLLTERLRPLKKDGQFVATPMLGYYVALARQVGCEVPDSKVRLGITPGQEEAGRALKRHYGLTESVRYAIVNPGAAYGAAKCWPAERFAEACNRIADRWGLRPVLVGAGGEIPLLREIRQKADTSVICCDDPGTTLGSLKPLVRDAALLLCNDTGPRHYGNAFNIPTVTIFGPTCQTWTDTDYAGEIKLQVPVECGPCMLRSCPLDHRCMTGVTVDMVIAAVERVLRDREGPAG